MDKILKLFPFISESTSEEFHGKTKLHSFIKDSMVKPPEEWTRVYYKGYERFEKIILPQPKKLQGSIGTVLRNRKSIRDFSSKPIKLADLSTLLYFSAGLKAQGKDAENRFYPSAGSRYPLELYLAINNCEGLKKGLYHYHIKTHSLEYLWPVNSDEFTEAFSHGWISRSPFILFITGVFWRTQVKYGNRGYRHVLTETGLLTQNIYLSSNVLNMGVCSLGGYLDDEINRFLGLQYTEESVLGVIAGGNIKN